MASQCWAVVVYFENEIETEAVVPSCWVKDDWLFWPTGVHVMKAAYKKFPIDDSWNKFRVKRIKVTGDKEVCEGYNFTTTEDSEEESYMFNTQENHLRSQVHPDVTNSTRDRSRSPIVQSKIVNFEINNSKSPKLPLHPKSITTNFKSSELGLQKKLDLSSSSSPAFLAGTSTQSFGTSSQFPLSTEKFQKKVFKQLLEIKNMVKDLQNVSSVVSEDLQINALSSIEQLIELDITLNDSVIFSKWVSQNWWS
ncbi:uncharacterized protein LOC136075098 isoform X2 [Hydra vulgaris]|uniref:Uncharacterized protein LOC136075098 isoform X2 n=1 Tax=Hydra vulgaris TaxID=6087 RepID=A0ABM4B3P0_HYDVU